MVEKFDSIMSKNEYSCTIIREKGQEKLEFEEIVRI